MMKKERIGKNKGGNKKEEKEREEAR